MLMGHNPLHREALVVDLWKRQRPAGVRTIGAVDVALWDLFGKAVGQPIHRLLGTYRESVPAYASSAVLRLGRSAYAEQAVEFKENGWAAYKIHPPTRWREDIKVCEAVRNAVGDYTIMLNSTWAYDYPAALRVGRAVEEMDFHWYEDPLADQDIYNYVKLKQQLSIPILATEYPITGLDSYQPWIMLQATDYLRGDVAVKGGITTLVKAAHLAESVPHELRGPSRRQFAEQRRQPACHRLDPEHRVLRGAAARRRAEIRPGAGHRGRPRRHGACAQRAGPGRRHRLQADRAQEDCRADLK